MIFGQSRIISAYLGSDCLRMRDMTGFGVNVFKDILNRTNADVAQWLERGSYKSVVAGSIPAFSILLYK